MTGTNVRGGRTERLRSVLLVAVASVVAACGSPAPSASVRPTVAASTLLPATATAATPTPLPTVASPLPTASPGSTPTPPEPTTGNTADDVIALGMAQQYVGDLVAGRYTRAWQLLSAQSQMQAGSLAAFTAERSAFFASAGTHYALLRPNNTDALLTLWLPQGFDGQCERAYVVRVKFPKLAGNNAGLAVLVVAPDADGWKVWPVR